MKEDVDSSNPPLPILNADHELHLKELFHVYSNLSTASASRSNLNTSSPALHDLSMDATRFVKFFKDQQLLNKHCTVTDLDIVFNKVKGPAKKERKIDYHAFKKALHILAWIRAHPDPNAPPESAITPDKAYLDFALQIYNTKEMQPIFHATVPETTGIFSKLTDKSKTSTDTENTPKKRNSQQNLLHATSAGNILGSSSKPSMQQPSRGSSHSSLLSAGTPTKSSTIGNADYVPTVPVIPKGSVFDRLTNTKYGQNVHHRG
ncbi:hypothetical protein HMI56_003301 [Coelomomyces lativittatus]|nr:hypothetical protein HMI56_003301 [Coelomomyces lativittatus]